MAMTDDNSSAILRETLEQTVVRPLDDFFRTKERYRAGYLLHLHPSKCEATRVLGSPSAVADVAIGEWIRRRVGASAFASAWEGREAVTLRAALDCIDELRDLRRGGRAEGDLFRGAVHLLRSEPYRLAGSPSSASVYHPYWKRGARSRPLGRGEDLTFLQRALAIGALREAGEVQMDEGEPLQPIGPPGGRCVTLAGMLGDRPTARVTSAAVAIAKLIAFLGDGEERWGALDFEEPAVVLMPLRSLGQWRSTFLWIADVRGVRTIASEATRLAISAIEDLLSGAVQDAFITSLSRILSDKQIDNAALKLAFGEAWWAEEIVFLQDSHVVHRRARNTAGDLDDVDGGEESRPAPASPRSVGTSYPGFLRCSWDQHGSTLYMDLDALIEQGSERSREMRQMLKEEWGFDAVRFRCTLMSRADSAAQLGRYADQLATRIASLLRDQLASRAGRRAEVYQSVGHWMKNAVECTGWYDSRNTLEDELPAIRKALSPSPASEGQAPLHAVEKALRSLQLFQIPASFGGLLRLASYAQRGAAPAKTAGWFTPQSLKTWEAEDDEVLDTYAASVEHIASVLLSARGGKLLEVRRAYRNGRTTETRPPVKGGFDQDKLRFPPLSRSKDADAVNAVLPALIEPMWNAIKHLHDKFQMQEPLRLTVMDRRRDCIEVTIENRVASEVIPAKTREAMRQKDSTAEHEGIEATRALCQISRMATMGSPEIVGAKGQRSVLVRIELHPQRLHEWMRGSAHDARGEEKR